MIETIYVEENVRDHPRARAIAGRYPRAVVVPVERYGEVFNRNPQSFRLQKKKPSLVLAEKPGRLVAPAPYGIGGEHNFYFSHVLNCLYDCRYCFLQGMYRSAHYVVFVNYEEFQEAMLETARAWPGEDVHFFSGYDGDSLVLEPLTGFVDSFLPFFAGHPRLVVELRTKSVAIRPLLTREPFSNCVVAFSFTPESISRALEHGVPPVTERVAAARKLGERGWRIGLRFDPLVFVPGFEARYGALFQTVFEEIPDEAIHSVGFGSFRLPQDYFRRVARMYPEERLFAASVEESEGLVSYPGDLARELEDFCRRELRERVSESRLFSY